MGQSAKGLRSITYCAPLKILTRGNLQSPCHQNSSCLPLQILHRELKKQELQYKDLFHTVFHSSQKAGFFIALHAQVQKKSDFPLECYVHLDLADRDLTRR